MGISLKNFTPKAEEALLKAQQEAARCGHARVVPVHLLHSLLMQEDGMIQPFLKQLGVDEDALRHGLDECLDELPNQAESHLQPVVSRALQSVLEQAKQTALRLDDPFVSPEHLLTGLLNVDDPATQLLTRLGLDLDKLLSLLKVVHQRDHESVSKSAGVDVLRNFCQDLLEAARRNQLDPVIGRDEEVRRVIRILSRRTKNNPVLIGEPGVGKTAIVEGLAQRILAGDVPEILKEKTLLSLDLGSLVAGAKFRGEFEERLKNLLKAIEDRAGEVILFIDEMHNLTGAGSSEGTMDAANLLKPALARGKLHCIGATTITEYKRFIEKDAALARRFQQILIPEPDADSALTILRGLKERYELHHGVHIRDAALVAAVELSHRYVSDRFLPDKAIDLMDEAASSLRIQMDSLPTDIDQLERRILQLQIEQAALIKEDYPLSRNRLEQLKAELDELRAQSSLMKSRWHQEREQLKTIQSLKERIEATRNEEREAQRQGDLERAAALHYETLDRLQQEMALAENKLELQGGNRLLKQYVDEEDIAHIVSLWTGIPTHRMMEEEKHTLVHLEERLNLRVIGQLEALRCVANAIRRSRAGLQDPERPMGSFIFQGGSGLGKTELACALAEFLFGDEKSLIRFDMSEYMEKASSTRLIGAPPGYVGFEEGGVLTEAVRRRPYCVLLFDEIEKAHPDIFNLFLQILDDGRLTDTQGRQVDFRNTLIIMTTNLGHEQIKEEEKITDDPIDLTYVARKELLKIFRTEFINRIDEIVVFRNLSLAHLKQIGALQLRNLQALLARQSIRLQVTEVALMQLAKKGYDPVFGVRPLKRLIQREIQDELAKRLLDGSLPQGSHVVVGVHEGHLTLEQQK